MGIVGLMKLINEECPECVKEQELSNLTGRKIAIDASMAMYQFLIAVRSAGQGQGGAMLMNEAGEITSHIQGMFNRTIRMMSSGLKPVYVFDGKPPQMKSGELAKRLAKRAKAEADLAAAKEAGEEEDIDRFSRRLVKVSRKHNEECKQLLRLMGVPVVDAPCEAEAQCAELARKNKVFATATEDMDALTFRTPKLLRKLTFSQTSKDKQPILEIDFSLMLAGLDLTYEQFVDLCILCGCDYCSSIKGVGPKTALKLIRQHKTLENIVEALKKEKKYDIPADWYEQKVPTNLPEEEENDEEDEENDDDIKNGTNDIKTETETSEEIQEETVIENKEVKIEIKEDASVATAELEVQDLMDEQSPSKLTTSESTPEAKKIELKEEKELLEGEYEIVPPLYVQARKLFHQCEILDAEEVQLKWTEPDEEGLMKFLVDEMGFNAERVISGIKRLKEAQQQKSQMRMDTFFAPKPSAITGVKRKQDTKKDAKKDAKKGKAGARRR